MRYDMAIEALLIVPFIASALLTLWVTPLTIRFARHYGLMDDPKIRHVKKIHTKPTPRAGGLATFIGIFATAFFLLPLDRHLAGIAIGALILLAMGLLDDKYDLSPHKRLFVQFLAAAVPIAFGVGVAFVSNPTGQGVIDLSHPQVTFKLLGNTKSVWVLSDLFALFWIVTIMNFLNWGAKGVDGQMSGVVGIAALTIAFLSLTFSADITEWPVVILAAAVAGSHFGFLPYHKYPQKIMPGFSGSSVAGYLLAILSILTTTKVGTLAVVLGVPLIDSGYTVVRRLASGRSPFWGDAGHLHHRLLRRGFSKAQVAYFYWGITAVLGLLALTMSATPKLYTLFGVAIFVLGLILWLTHKQKT